MQFHRFFKIWQAFLAEPRPMPVSASAFPAPQPQSALFSAPTPTHGPPVTPRKAAARTPLPRTLLKFYGRMKKRMSGLDSGRKLR
jgi:hypothetical protein